MRRKIIHLLLTASFIMPAYSAAYSQRKRVNKNPVTSSSCNLTLKDAPKIRGLYLGMSIEEFKRILPDMRLSVSNPDSEFGEKIFDVSTVGNQAFAGLTITKAEFFEEKLYSITVAYDNYEPASIDEFAVQAAAKLNLPKKGWVGWTSKDTKTRSLGCSDFLIKVGLGEYSKEGWQPPYLSMVDKNVALALARRKVSSLINKIKQEAEEQKKRRVFKP